MVQIVLALFSLHLEQPLTITQCWQALTQSASLHQYGADSLKKKKNFPSSLREIFL